MRSKPIDEMLLIKYLLGKLTEQEQILVEDRAFADRNYLDALEAAETDLIDAYAHNELSQTDRRVFEWRFLTSTQRRSKVEFARALASIGAESEVRESPNTGSLRWPTIPSTANGSANSPTISLNTWVSARTGPTMEARRPLHLSIRLPTSALSLACTIHCRFIQADSAFLPEII